MASAAWRPSVITEEAVTGELDDEPGAQAAPAPAA
jgi:hypothetical protein